MPCFLKVDEKLRRSQSEEKAGICTVWHSKPQLKPQRLWKGIIMERNGLPKSSHSRAIVCGVNKQTLHSRATVASLSRSISVIWREQLKRGKTAVTHRLTGAYSLCVRVCVALISSTCLFHHIFIVLLISTAQVVYGSTITSVHADGTFWFDSTRNRYCFWFRWFWILVADGAKQPAETTWW